jgi:FkbM family methyltransferase
MGQQRGRFDRIELMLIAVFVAVTGFGAGVQYRDSAPLEGAYLDELYGPHRYSRNREEWIIRDFFRDERNGFFLDVGANHYRTESNTYFLERELGWSGIALEPLVRFEAEYLEHRPRTRFRGFFVSDASSTTARMFLLEQNTLVSSSDRNFTARHGSDVTVVDVPTITLNDLLDHEGVTAIDFLSMDIELHEPQALAGFDVRRFRPRFVCIEAHAEVRQSILDYFIRNGYTIVGQYVRAEVLNLFFMPLPAPLSGS